MIRRYVKNFWPEYIVTSFIGAACTRAVFSGFYMNDPFSGNIFFIMLSAFVLTAFYYAAAYRRVLTIIGIVLGVMAVSGAALYARSVDLLENEEANSVFIFFTISFLSSLIAFLLGRTRVGTGVLFIVLIFVNAFVNFLKFPSALWCFLVSVCGCIVLFFLRNYRVHSLKASLGNIDVKYYALQSLIVTIVAALISAGLYFAVVRPLNPPTQSLKLITQLKSMEIINVLGISDFRIITDPDLVTDQDTDRTEQSDSDKKKDEETKENSSDNNETKGSVQTMSGSLTEQLSAVSYTLFKDLLLLKIILLATAVIAVLCLIRLYIRYRWHKKVLSLSANDAAVNYYRYFFKRFEKMGLKKQKNYTFSDYAAFNEVRLKPFAQKGADFRMLSQIYERVIYGGDSVNEEELEKFENFYTGFFNTLKKEVGGFKYFLTQFRY